MRSDGGLLRARLALPEVRTVRRLTPSRTDECDSITARKGGVAVADRWWSMRDVMT